MRAADAAAADSHPTAGGTGTNGVGPAGGGEAGLITAPPDLTGRILYILYRGLTEIRNLGYGGRSEQIAELADALELLPGMLVRWDDKSLEMLQFVLSDYERKYPVGRYDYTPYLDKWPVPDHY